MVRDLVGRQSGRGAYLLGGGKQVGPEILVRQPAQSAPIPAHGKRRARLDRQLIEREVPGPEADRLGQLLFPFA